jgi:hypothetical protein
MEKTTLDEVAFDLKKNILMLEGMMESYKTEMLRNYNQLEKIKAHIIRTNHLLVNIRKLMDR